MSTKNTEIESVAKVLIVDKARRALILTLGKHLQHPERSFTPDLPGGVVEPGESEWLAAIRETKEETGIDLNITTMRLAYAGTDYYPDQQKSVTKLLYICQVSETPDVTLSWEHSKYQWIPLSELHLPTAFRPFYNDAIAYSLAHKLV